MEKMEKMKVLRYSAPRQAEIVITEAPRIQPTEVLARSICCNVSAGTEMPFYRGTSLFFQNKIVDGLFEEASNSLAFPLQSDMPGAWYMGYANVAEVVAVGSERKDFKVGDMVFNQGTHQSYQRLDSSFSTFKLPPGANPDHASCAILADIAFNSILDAKVKLMDRVVVIGLGTIGQLIVQMAKLSGAYVYAVDLLETRLALAKKMGADRVINPKKDGNLGALIQKDTNGGADAVLEVSGNSRALADAIRCCRKDGQVTVVSFYQEPPITLMLGKEFHNRRIRLVSSGKGGIMPSLTFQYDRKRRIQTAFELLTKLNIEALISHRVSFDEYPKALDMIDKNHSDCQAVIIKY